jgi:hypothetical protein
VSPDGAGTARATLVATDPSLLGPVLARVVGMLAARAQAPIDRLDDALLLSDAVAAHAPSHAVGGRVEIRVDARRSALSLEVRSLVPGGGAALLEAASVPGVGNVLRHVADETDVRDDELHLTLAFR